MKNFINVEILNEEFYKCGNFKCGNFINEGILNEEFYNMRFLYEE